MRWPARAPPLPPPTGGGTAGWFPVRATPTPAPQHNPPPDGEPLHAARALPTLRPSVVPSNVRAPRPSPSSPPASGRRTQPSTEGLALARRPILHHSLVRARRPIRGEGTHVPGSRGSAHLAHHAGRPWGRGRGREGWRAAGARSSPLLPGGRPVRAALMSCTSWAGAAALPAATTPWLVVAAATTRYIHTANHKGESRLRRPRAPPQCTAAPAEIASAWRPVSARMAQHHLPGADPGRPRGGGIHFFTPASGRARAVDSAFVSEGRAERQVAAADAGASASAATTAAARRIPTFLQAASAPDGRGRALRRPALPRPSSGPAAASPPGAPAPPGLLHAAGAASDALAVSRTRAPPVGAEEEEEGAASREADAEMGAVPAPDGVWGEQAKDAWEDDLPAEELSFHEVLSGVATGEVACTAGLRSFEAACRQEAVALRERSRERLHHTAARHVLEMNAALLQAEAGTWALLWHLYGSTPVGVPAGRHVSVPLSASQLANGCREDDPITWRVSRVVAWCVRGSVAHPGRGCRDTDRVPVAGRRLEELAAVELGLPAQEWEGREEDLFYTGGDSLRRNTLRASDGRAGADRYVTELDPDACDREGLALHEEDQRLERHLLKHVWQLLRAGHLEAAARLCVKEGHAWRAVTLGGCGGGGPCPVTLCGHDAAERENDEAAAAEQEASVGAASCGPLAHRWLWKWACYMASKSLAGPGAPAGRAGDGGPRGVGTTAQAHEAAIYGALCGNLEAVLPVCTDWAACAWAHFRAWLDVRVDEALGRTHGSERASAKHWWPAPEVLAQRPPGEEPAQEIFRSLADEHRSPRAVVAECRERQRVVQRRLILGEWRELVADVRDWTNVDGEADREGAAACHPRLMRSSSAIRS
eukprot:scaffold1853_cov367-Prasinococcus_capsulatus_cf.AAC.3